MNIYGLGCDLVNTKRVERLFLKKSSFKKRIFSKNEINYCEKKNNKYLSYSKRFAAKEAFSKALGTGIRKGLNFNEIEVINDVLGKPKLAITGKSLAIVKKILKKKTFKSYISISDDGIYALSTVLILV